MLNDRRGGQVAISQGPRIYLAEGSRVRPLSIESEFRLYFRADLRRELGLPLHYWLEPPVRRSPRINDTQCELRVCGVRSVPSNSVDEAISSPGTALERHEC